MRTRRRTIRQRRERKKRLGRLKSVFLGLLFLLLLAAAVFKGHALEPVLSVFSGQEEAQADVLLPKMTVYALQLGVYDSGESAEKARLALLDAGLPCIIWQREKMRLIGAASDSREKLENLEVKGRDTCIIREEFPEVSVRMTAGSDELETARHFLRLPDLTLEYLIKGEEPIETILSAVRQEAEREAGAHPDNALYTQLAQSLVNWCALMEHSAERGLDVPSYASATMATLCRELRITLLERGN